MNLLPWLRLLRVGTLFSPAADVVAGACLAGATWSADVARGAAASVMVYAAGMVLNDHADRAEDARQRPERPIPSGAISPGAALGLGLALLAGGLAIAPWRLAWGALVALVLLYDYVLKRRIETAAPTMGALRALNLCAGAALADFALPGGQTVLVAAGAYFVYVLSVTVLGAFEDETSVTPRAVVGVQSAAPFAALLALLALPDRWPTLAIGVVLVVLFLGRMRRRGQTWDRSAIRGSMTWLLLGTMAYTSLLCLGSGRGWEALAIATAIIPGAWISRSIALT